MERGLRESRAVDTEALCVLAGRKVPALQAFEGILNPGLDEYGDMTRTCCTGCAAHHWTAGRSLEV